MRRLALSLAFAFPLLAASCGGSSGHVAAPAPSSSFAGSEIPGKPLPAPGFTLRDQAGRTVRLADERGKNVVVAFLYTHCPDTCPLIASNLNTALRRLGPRRNSLSVLAVSVDPKNDTPAAVRRYVKLHRLLPQFRYLTGTKAELAPIWKAYHVSVVPDAKGNVAGHSSYEVLVDPAGNQRVLYDASVTADDVLHDLKRLR